MKIQFNILKRIISKNYIWIIILYFLLILCLIYYSVRPGFEKNLLDDYLLLINYPLNVNKNSIQTLIYLYYILLNSFLFYDYVSYEITNCCENVLLRINKKKWIFFKIVIYTLFIFIMCLINSIIFYLYFLKKFPFDVRYIIIPFFYFILHNFIILFLFYIFNSKKLIIFILSFVIVHIIYYIQNVMGIIILIIIFFILSVFFFDIRRVKFDV